MRVWVILYEEELIILKGLRAIQLRFGIASNPLARPELKITSRQALLHQWWSASIIYSYIVSQGNLISLQSPLQSSVLGNCDSSQNEPILEEENLSKLQSAGEI